MSASNPTTLLYDGQCGICQEWVNYWHLLTGDKIRYVPYQEALHEYPNIDAKELAEAIHFIEADGRLYKGAEATFRLYQGIHPQSILLFFYRFLPGFSFISELAYRFFSTHRGLLGFITHLFWGKEFKPPQHKLISGLFLRLLACVYLAAFISFTVQAEALIGADGVLPLEYFLNAVEDQLVLNKYIGLPTLFWFSHSDLFINVICYAGIVFSLCLLFGFLKLPSLILLYVLYLSIVNGGQVFLSFQWDMLLLECGFLAIFLLWGSKITVWLYRWLIFRFMFLGGVVKIASGDVSWDSLTALSYHFETQPLPSPLSWYVHHLHESILMTATGITLIIELIIPFFIFAPRRFRHVAGICFIFFQTIILLTGNYNFFNLLTIFMCLFLFDDAAIKRILPNRILYIASNKAIPRTGMVATSCAALMAFICIYIGASQIAWVMNRDKDRISSTLYRLVAPFGVVNLYGPFAVMTRVRNEIVIEGSSDSVTWQEYQFKYKPGDLEQCPVWLIPHQPRIDWQMWFAALSKPDQQRWLFNTMFRLLQNSKPVTDIFEYNPFPEEPPVSVRALFYKYTFTSYEERKETGKCWNREYIGEYFPAISIRKSN